MNFSNLSIERLHERKHVYLSYSLPETWSSETFNSKFIECLSILSELMDISTVSMELTSSHTYAVIFSRYFAKVYGTFDIKSYYPNSEEINLPKLTPYHSWELMDDAKDFHIKQEGTFLDGGLSFHLYPQLYSARIFEKVTPENSTFEFFIEDDSHDFSLNKKNGNYWFTPSTDLEAENLPFHISIWFTKNTFELDLIIHWNVFAIEGTPSNLALQDTLNRFIKKGWNLDKDSDVKTLNSSDAKSDYAQFDVNSFFKLPSA